MTGAAPLCWPPHLPPIIAFLGVILGLLVKDVHHDPCGLFLSLGAILCLAKAVL